MILAAHHDDMSLWLYGHVTKRHNAPNKTIIYTLCYVNQPLQQYKHEQLRFMHQTVTNRSSFVHVML